MARRPGFLSYKNGRNNREVDYYSGIKRQEVLLCATAWLNLENVM